MLVKCLGILGRCYGSDLARELDFVLNFTGTEKTAR